MTFVLCKYKNQWAMFDTVSRVYYFGPKKELEKRIQELNKPAIKKAKGINL